MAKAQTKLEQLVTDADILATATHNFDAVRAWCDRMIRLEGGRIVADGPTAQVLEHVA